MGCSKRATAVLAMWLLTLSLPKPVDLSMLMFVAMFAGFTPQPD